VGFSFEWRDFLRVAPFLVFLCNLHKFFICFLCKITC